MTMTQLNQVLQEYQKLSEQSEKTIAPVWQRMTDHLAKMSNEQIAFINNDQRGLSAKQSLNTFFIEWLFEKFKNDFVKIESFNVMAQNYVDTIITISNEYLQEQATLKQDNESMRKELEELRKLRDQNISDEVLV